MQTTANYGLKKPDGTDVVDIQNFNDNADIIDAELKKINNNAGVLSGLKTTAKNTLVAAINEVFQSGTNVKTNTISAVNSKGGNLSTSATWDQIISAIKSIARGQGNAVESQVLKGATFSNSDGIKRTGTMDLKSENIKEGVTYGGVAGTLNLESLGGRKYASGGIDYDSNGGMIHAPYTVSNLTFKPSIIFVRCYYIGDRHIYLYTLYNTAIKMLNQNDQVINQFTGQIYGSDSMDGHSGGYITTVNEHGFTYNLESSEVEYIYWFAIE